MLYAVLAQEHALWKAYMYPQPFNEFERSVISVGIKFNRLVDGANIMIPAPRKTTYYDLRIMASNILPSPFAHWTPYVRHIVVFRPVQYVSDLTMENKKKRL